MNHNEYRDEAMSILEEHDSVRQEDMYESDYSLDYEFTGPRYSNYRISEEEGIASELSDDETDPDLSRFDMWDDDPYNDFTWESNDMQLTKFIKKKQKELFLLNKGFDGFWTKKKGWPKQLPFSCSTTNHDQSANAICLVESNYGISEQLFAVYRDRVIQCGKPPMKKKLNRLELSKHKHSAHFYRNTTWIENHESYQNHPTNSSSHKFIDTHQSISISNIYSESSTPQLNREEQEEDENQKIYMSQNLIHKFKPYTKFIKRSDFPGTLPEEAYLYPGFDPQCIAYKYGYLAIGGVEGEFELYCCMDPDHPVKIWGTKFKGKGNVMLMTNSIQLVRWRNPVTAEYVHMLIGCMNEAGLLFYHLPPHEECRDIRSVRLQQKSKVKTYPVKLHSHIKSFNGVPINDAKLSPDGTQLVCVGDENIIFMIDVYQCTKTSKIRFGNPIQIVIPPVLLQQIDTPSYSSQYVAWSPSSKYFAHTSDSHNLVLVWRASTKEIIYSIDAAGYTYAIAFHPHVESILVFTNRYGYFHTVDFSKATSDSSKDHVNILNFTCDKESSHVDPPKLYDKESIHHPDDSLRDHTVFHTKHLHVRHEITMVSFRGEIDKRLRILAKINGIEWSKDGKYLYVATKKRVLAFQLSLTEQCIPKLIDITGSYIKCILEKHELIKSRKRKATDSSCHHNSNYKILNHWPFIPEHIRSRILGNKHNLACHW